MNTLRTILVIGSGGREQAIAFKLAESQEVGSVYICPDPMTPFASEKIRGLNLNPNHFDELSQFTIQKNIDLVVVGPEVPLVNGVVDFLENKGVPVLGPSKKGAKLEGSKHFSKQLMKDFKIPTAAFKNASFSSLPHRFFNATNALNHLAEFIWQQTHFVIISFHPPVDCDVFFNHRCTKCDGCDGNFNSTFMA